MGYSGQKVWNTGAKVMGYSRLKLWDILGKNYGIYYGFNLPKTVGYIG